MSKDGTETPTGSKCMCIGRRADDYAEYCAIRDVLGKERGKAPELQRSEPIRKLPEPMKFSKGNMYCSNYFKCTCCRKWFEIYDDIDENYMCFPCKNKMD